MLASTWVTHWCCLGKQARQTQLTATGLRTSYRAQRSCQELPRRLLPAQEVSTLSLLQAKMMDLKFSVATWDACLPSQQFPSKSKSNSNQDINHWSN
mmetsp:Transcript_13990/g.22250  ORF Transcript_13990/g.22250 Transcript_13990/m.22250 type:complete len:97 (+) Transcript_13990:304-594(+)